MRVRSDDEIQIGFDIQGPDSWSVFNPHVACNFKAASFVGFKQVSEFVNIYDYYGIERKKPVLTKLAAMIANLNKVNESEI
jgi:hypothetical protein